MTFWDHLDELRRVLFRVIGVWFVLAIGYFVAMPYLFDHVILAPCHNDFVFYDLLRFIGQKFDLTDEFFTQEFKVKLVNINLAAPFFIHMSTAFWMSVVTAMPYIFFEVWRFINPALYPNERKGVRKALTIGTGMFFIGVLMGYFMVYPLTLRFLSTYQLSSEVENILSLNSYIDNFMMLILCMGLAFELPLVTWLLSLLGVVNKSFLRKYRRHAVVIIVIAAAIITPTGDPFTLSVVAIPLYLLYEMSILMIKDKKEVPELEEEEEEGDPREELVRRLIEYKIYKYAAEELKDLSVDAQKVFFKPETVPEEIKHYEEPIRPGEIVGDVTLEKLNQIFRMVMRRKKDREDPVRSHFGKIQKEKYKVEDRMDDIRCQIRGLKRINFRTLLDIQPVKEMVIVTFLAVLELMKVGEVKVVQEHNFAEIYLDSCE